MIIKLLMPIHNQIGKGTYWRSFGFAQDLVRRGHSVTILAAGRLGQRSIEEKYINGVRLLSFPNFWARTIGSGYDPRNLTCRIFWVYRHSREFDLVHAYESRPVSLFPAAQLQRQGIQFISDWCDWFGRGGSVEERSNPIKRFLLRPIETVFEEKSRRWSDGLTVINHTLYKKALEIGIEEQRILLLPNGAYVEDFRPKNRTSIRAQFGLPLKAPLIAYTGSLFKRDAILMATAFDHIHANQPDVRLLLIGYCNIAIEELVRVPEAVIRTGQVTFSDLADYVASSTMGWIPLIDSGANTGRFPMKLNDFMASGRAVVVTDVGDLGKVVRQYGLGLVTKPKAEHLAQAVLKLLYDPVRRKEIENQTRKVAETIFAWPVLTDRLEQFYLRIIDKQHHDRSQRKKFK